MYVLVFVAGLLVGLAVCNAKVFLSCLNKVKGFVKNKVNSFKK